VQTDKDLLLCVVQRSQEVCDGGFFPAQTLSLFLVFESCFTVPSFVYFRAYERALMVVEGRKCMTRLARCAVFHPRHLSSWERFLAEHCWSLRAVTERLVTPVVSQLGDKLQVHGGYSSLYDSRSQLSWHRGRPGCSRAAAIEPCDGLTFKTLLPLKLAADPPPLAPVRLEQGRFAWASATLSGDDGWSDLPSG